MFAIPIEEGIERNKSEKGKRHSLRLRQRNSKWNINICQSIEYWIGENEKMKNGKLKEHDFMKDKVNRSKEVRDIVELSCRAARSFN